MLVNCCVVVICWFWCVILNRWNLLLYGLVCWVDWLECLFEIFYLCVLCELLVMVVFGVFLW